MRVLVDYHHADLVESWHLLFGDRFGMTVYHPIGREWFDEWYWSFGRPHLGEALARQFLYLDDTYTLVGDHYENRDRAHPERLHRFVTLQQFRDMGRWDLVVATVPDNEQGFHRIAQESGAHYVIGVGNTNQPVDWSLDPIALVSSEMPIEGRGIRYHQEIRVDYREPTPWGPTIASFVNCFPSMGCYSLHGEVWRLVPHAWMPVFGIDGPEGNLNPTSLIVDYMGESTFGWHDKEHGDGFGHVIHSWAAVGRPLIGHASHYRGKLAAPLWEDGVTAIDLGKHTIPEVADLIRSITPERHERMCRAIRSRFEELVDYDREADAIADLLGVGVAA